jgi:hypothetical protein
LADLEVGSGVGKNHVEGHSARAGVEQPVDQVSPNGLEQGAWKRGELGACKRHVVDGDQHHRGRRDVPPPRLGRLQRDVVKEPVRPAERWETAGVIAGVTDQGARRDEHRRGQAGERLPVSDAPVAEIHKVDPSVAVQKSASFLRRVRDAD